MHWVIQQGLYSTEDQCALIRSLDRCGVLYDVVSVDKRSVKMVPDVNPSGLVMVCGTYSLSRIAVERLWRPGTFLNRNHNHRAWVSAWGDLMLNADALTCQLRDVAPTHDRIFIRPLDDNKFFDGQVMDCKDVKAFRDAVLCGVRPHIPCSERLVPDTQVVYGPAIAIYREARLFVIDGEIVAWSTFRIGRNVVASPDVDPAALEFGRAAVAAWQPARGFALDVALTAGGYRIVEVNCLNMSRFYGADIQRIVAAIETMVFDA